MKYLITLSFFIFGFWLTPRLGEYIFLKSLNSPYSIEEKWHEDVTDFDKGIIRNRTHIFYYNSLGNPMRPKRKGEKSCLILGGSTYYSQFISQEESFLSQLDRFSPGIYFEPYVFASLRDGQARIILNDILRRGKEYDCVLMGLQATGEIDLSKDAAFPFWSQWRAYANKPLYWLLDKFLNSSTVIQNLKSAIIEDKEHGPTPKVKAMKLRRDRPELFEYHPTNLDDDLERRWKNRYKKLFELAQKVSPNVFFIMQPIAYSKTAHPDIGKRWTDLYERELKSGEIVYLNNRAIAEEKRVANAVAKGVTNQIGVKIFDLDGHIKKMLDDNADIFEDKWHFSSQGAEIAGKYVAKEVMNELD